MVYGGGVVDECQRHRRDNNTAGKSGFWTEWRTNGIAMITWREKKRTHLRCLLLHKFIHQRSSCRSECPLFRRSDIYRNISRPTYIEKAGWPNGMASDYDNGKSEGLWVRIPHRSNFLYCPIIILTSDHVYPITLLFLSLTYFFLKKECWSHTWFLRSITINDHMHMYVPTV